MDSPKLGPGGDNKISRMEISFGWCAAALVFKIFLVGVSIRVVRDGIGVQRIAAARLARTPPVRLANYPTNPFHLSFASMVFGGGRAAGEGSWPGGFSLG